MNSISSFSQNIISKESALNFAVTGVVSLVSARFIPMSIKECAIFGSSVATLSSAGNALIGHDASDFKKVLVAIAALALTFYGAYSFAPVINARFAVALTPQSITNLLVFNAIGQVVSFALAKTLFAAPWNMSDSQIQQLHAKYIENPEHFKELPVIEQQVLYKRFLTLGLNLSKFNPVEPTTEEVAALSDKEVLTLYQHNVFFVEEGSHALLLRYFELNLDYRGEYSYDIKKVELSIPETSQEVKGLSTHKIIWYKEFFSKNDQARKKLPFEVQWAFYQKGCETSYTFDSEYLEHAPPEQIEGILSEPLTFWIDLSLKCQTALAKRAEELGFGKYPVHPTAPEEVKDLPEDVIHAYHSQLPSFLNKDVTAAFNRLFYDLNLPLPNGINTIGNQIWKDWNYSPEIDIPLPKTVSDVTALHDNQLPWVYFACKDHFDILSFEVQSSLNDRFVLTNNHWINFTHSKLTVEGIQTVSENNIKRLHDQFLFDLTDWTELPQDIQKALNARFSGIKRKTITLNAVDPTDLSKLSIEAFHKAFTKQDANWHALPNAKQQTFNAAFAKFEGLAQLPVKIW